MNTSLILAVAVLKGPFPLLVTPWTEKAELDVPVLVKEAEYVGYVTTDLGDKPNGIGNYLKLARDPSAIVVPLTDDEVREGYGQTMDRIVKPDDVK